MRARHLLIAIMATGLVGGTMASAAVATAADEGAPAVESFAGQLDDETEFAFDVPLDWNGTVFIDLDYVGSSRLESAWLLDHGYAVGGTERNTVGYAYQQAAENMTEALERFQARFGSAETAVVWGRSRGGFVARATIERHPGVFDGALAACGGGNGVIGTFNQKLDAVYALQQLLEVDEVDALQVVDIPADQVVAQQVLLGRIVDRAADNPEGRARLALAAAFSQMQTWSDPSLPRPGARDWDGQIDNIASTFAFGHPAVVRGPIEHLAGGNFSWNHGVDYGQLFAQSQLKDLVRTLYDEAGLSLQDDLDRLAAAPRISADPAAVAFVEQNVTYTGQIHDPVMTLHTIGDPADPLPFERGYADTLRAAGSAPLLRQAYVDRPGHCNMRPSEVLASMMALLDRIETGSWGASAHPRQLDMLATRLAAGSDLDLGAAEFVHVPVPHPLRSWDVDDWGTYTP